MAAPDWVCDDRNRHLTTWHNWIFIANTQVQNWRRASQTATQDGPIVDNGDPHVRGGLLRLISLLPQDENFRDCGLRFVAMPSFGDTDYAVSIGLPPGGKFAAGTLVTVPSGKEAPIMARNFRIPEKDFHRLMTSINRELDANDGYGLVGTDGTPVAIETYGKNGIRSAAGNVYNERYDTISRLVLNSIREWAPGDDLPYEDDWHRIPE